MRIISYNVNGLRAAMKKGFCEWLQTHPADVICIQESKAQQADVDCKVFTEMGYYDYWFCAKMVPLVAIICSTFISGS